MPLLVPHPHLPSPAAAEAAVPSEMHYLPAAGSEALPVPRDIPVHLPDRQSPKPEKDTTQ